MAQIWRSPLFRLLARTLGTIPEDRQRQIEQLSMAQVERLHEALLTFANVEELSVWLGQTLEEQGKEA